MMSYPTSKYKLFPWAASYLILLLLMSCSTQNRSGKTSSLQRSLCFGKGGGITGKIFDYRLDENGDLYKIERDQTKICGNVPRNTTRQVFINYDRLMLGNVKLKNPGNVYYYIQMTDRDMQQHALTWGGTSAPDPDIVTYFSILTDIIRKYERGTNH